MAFIQHGDFTPNSNVKGFATNKLSQLHNILHRRLMEPQDSPSYMEDVCYQIPETLHDENLALFMFCIIIYLSILQGDNGDWELMSKVQSVGPPYPVSIDFHFTKTCSACWLQQTPKLLSIRFAKGSRKEFQRDDFHQLNTVQSFSLFSWVCSC